MQIRCSFWVNVPFHSPSPFHFDIEFIPTETLSPTSIIFSSPLFRNFFVSSNDLNTEKWISREKKDTRSYLFRKTNRNSDLNQLSPIPNDSSRSSIFLFIFVQEVFPSFIRFLGLYGLCADFEDSEVLKNISRALAVRFFCAFWLVFWTKLSRRFKIIVTSIFWEVIYLEPRQDSK